MNLLLLENSQFVTETRVKLLPRQATHLSKVLKSSIGDTLQIGRLNGKIGRGEVISLDIEDGEIEVLSLDRQPEPQLPLDIILGLPRPQMIKRILQTISTMGVRHLHFIQSSRVEKSFWQSPVLFDNAIQHQLILGAEQAKVTQIPKVTFHKRFRPFIEDELDTLTAGAKKLISHPGDYPSCYKVEPSAKHILAIGPEGGFIEKEVESFLIHGFNPVQLGERILKVETAIPVLIAKLF